MLLEELFKAVDKQKVGLRTKITYLANPINRLNSFWSGCSSAELSVKVMDNTLIPNKMESNGRIVLLTAVIRLHHLLYHTQYKDFHSYVRMMGPSADRYMYIWRVL